MLETVVLKVDYSGTESYRLDNKKKDQYNRI